MVDVADRPHVGVRLCPLEFLLGHYFVVLLKGRWVVSRLGAQLGTRTRDLVLTKDALCRLS